MSIQLEKYHLKSSSLFDFISKDDVAYIKGQIVRKEFAKGEYLFKERNFSKGVYIIRKGKVKIFQSSSEGKVSIVYIYKKDDYFGYRPLLANEPHPVSAVAMDHVVVSFISSEIFLRVLSRSNDLARNLLGVLSKEFSVWVNKMTVFAHYGVRERVSLSLLILNKVYQRKDQDARMVNIAINRDDFAAFVGTAKETLVRMLRIFKDEGMISSKGTKIIVLKPRQLLNMVSDM